MIVKVTNEHLMEMIKNQELDRLIKGISDNGKSIDELDIQPLVELMSSEDKTILLYDSRLKQVDGFVRALSRQEKDLVIIDIIGERDKAIILQSSGYANDVVISEFEMNTVPEHFVLVDEADLVKIALDL